MGCFQREIFGPVMLCMEADSLEEAIEFVNFNKCNSTYFALAYGIIAYKITDGNGMLSISSICFLQILTGR